MSTAEARASQEAIESATMDELVRSGLLTRERLISLGIMQEVEDMAELIDRGEISLQILAEVGFEIDAAEAAVLTAEAQEMLVAAGIIPDSENLPLDHNDVQAVLDMERALIARAAEAQRTTEQDERAEDLKLLSRVYVLALMNAGFLNREWLITSGIIPEGDALRPGICSTLISAGVITLNALQARGFKITAGELRSLNLGQTGNQILALMNLVEETTNANLTDDPDPNTSH